jgi:hypothetical protein
MKKLLIAGAAAAALFSFGAAPASAAPNFSQLCTANGDLGVSHGECTSILNGYYNKGQGSNDAAALCRDFRAEDPDFFGAAWGNLGKCVAFWKPVLPG